MTNNNQADRVELITELIDGLRIYSNKHVVSREQLHTHVEEAVRFEGESGFDDHVADTKASLAELAQLQPAVVDEFFQLSIEDLREYTDTELDDLEKMKLRAISFKK